MKIIPWASLALAGSSYAYEWQVAGYCGVPSVNFDQSMLAAAKGRSGNSGRLMEQEEVNEALQNASNAIDNSQCLADAEISWQARMDHIEANRDNLVEAINFSNYLANTNLCTGEDTQPDQTTLNLLDAFNNIEDKSLFYHSKTIEEIDDFLSQWGTIKSGLNEWCLQDLNAKSQRVAKRHQHKDSQNYKKAHEEENSEYKTAYLEELCPDETRVVGGEDATANAWPWQVYMSICGTFYGMMECNVCGGSIISDRYIISAAHCVPKDPRGRILVGAHDLDEDNYWTYHLGEMTIHPDWNFPKRFQNDIAVVQAKGGDTFTIDYARSAPVCLPHPQNSFAPGTTCVVSGWGLTDERGGLSSILQVAGVKLIDREQCRQYSGYNMIAKSMLCAGFEEGQHDACSGDSGGPLVCRMPAGERKGAWVLHGVVSWGYGCARPNSPGIYTDVQHYSDWIQEVTGGAEYGLRYDVKLANMAVNGEGVSQGADPINPDDTYKPCSKTNSCNILGDAEEVNNNEGNSDNGFITLNEDIEVGEIPFVDHGACPYVLKNPDGSEIMQELGATFSYVNNDVEVQTTEDDATRSANQDLKSFNEIFYKPNGHQIPKLNCVWTWSNTDADRYILLNLSASLMSRCRASNNMLEVYIDYEDQNKVKKTISYCETPNGNVKIMSKTYIQVYLKTTHEITMSTFTPQLTVAYEFADDTMHCPGPGAFEFLEPASQKTKVTLTSPQFPKSYQSHQECRWQISSNYPIRIYVERLNTERSRNCNKYNDNLFFFVANDCSSDTLKDKQKHKVYGVLCGALRNRNYRIGLESALHGMSNPNGGKLNLCVVFQGDRDNKHGKGFKLVVETAKNKPAKKRRNRRRKG